MVISLTRDSLRLSKPMDMSVKGLVSVTEHKHMRRDFRQKKFGETTKHRKEVCVALSVFCGDDLQLDASTT